MTTLLQAHQRFSEKLDELRRRYVATYEVWLKSLPGDSLDALQRAGRDRLAIERKKFADEFVDQPAADLVHALNPAAERDIMRTLRTFEARSEPLRPTMPAGERRWMPSLWRTVLAAAFGAVAAVMLLTLQPVGEVTRDKLVLWLLAAAFVSALGAAAGVLLIASPPLSALFERFGLKGAPLQMAKTLGSAFLLFRVGPVIILVAALLSGFFALIAWLLGGSQPLHVLIGLTALLVILAGRWTAPGADVQDRASLQRRLAAELDTQLRGDANVWAALSAALVIRRSEAPVSVPLLDDVINVVVSRRKNNDPPERILQVISQRLGIAPDQAGYAPEWPGEFIWKTEHEDTFETFGVVEVGDTVIVSAQPNVIVRLNGSRQVTRRGLVARKDA